MCCLQIKTFRRSDLVVDRILPPNDNDVGVDWFSWAKNLSKSPSLV